MSFYAHIAMQRRCTILRQAWIHIALCCVVLYDVGVAFHFGTSNDSLIVRRDVSHRAHCYRKRGSSIAQLHVIPDKDGVSHDGSDFIGGYQPGELLHTVQDLELCDELSQSFMKYALSIILGRALPDARDGLKIVHRRILWAMQVMKLGASTPYRKCAKVVGDVLGKYHPHSDKSVYDALCRLSQLFMMRVPLVDGHGNFGSTDDPPAAMRYTECRLSPFSEKLLLAEMGKNTVDMLPNFDSTEMEPTVLPSKVPLLLINGSSGIAVGLATNIPPHNPEEILKAASLMAKNHGNVDTEELLNIVRGPDFPTGGHIVTSIDALRKIYTTGKGSIMLQAKYIYEERIKPRNSKRESDVVVNTYSDPSHLSFTSGSRVSIIVKELPYNVRLSDVMLAISKAVETGALRGISDLRDESDRGGLRLVIELKKHITTHLEVEEIMQKLKKMSGLCSFFKCNFIALDSSGTKPVRLSLYSALKIWLEFRVQTVRKRIERQREQAKERLNIVKGFAIAFNKIDDIVHMVRNSSSSAEAMRMLSEKRYGGLNAEQASAVLRMSLSQLSRIERDKIDLEEKELSESIKRYNHILGDESHIYSLIYSELEHIRQNPEKHYTVRHRCTTLSVSGHTSLGDGDVAQDYPPELGGNDEEFVDSISATIAEDHIANEPGNDPGDLVKQNPDLEGHNPHDEPSLIVMNNYGLMQRIKLDNSFFRSQKSRYIPSSRLQQPYQGQYSIGEGENEDVAPEITQSELQLHYGVCRPGDSCMMISKDGTCFVLPVSALRLCNKGYSIWKQVKLKSPENVEYFTVTSKLLFSQDQNSGVSNCMYKLIMDETTSYLVLIFTDGQVGIISTKHFPSGHLYKNPLIRLRLWNNKELKPIFAMFCCPDDDIFVGTLRGYSLRVRLNDLLGGMEHRGKTRKKLIKLKENDKVTCGAILESLSNVENDAKEICRFENYDNRHLLLLSEHGRAKLLHISELQLRRHGGYGYNITRQSSSTIEGLYAATVVDTDDDILLVSKDGLLARKDPFTLPVASRHQKMRKFWTRMRAPDRLQYMSPV
ncbi:DNA gyrase/topoisomerase IV subunit A family protein [Babesia bovis T2Bo]|uniref:DNA gyrase A subunit, putative n=1 Tax=Babesia bovis TaxID=5865 RepID=A7AVY4_BABBO|nr:DNA gyrase/topoisomerase IV subunit A family protein [Babesia bovis T2Bo]EDO05960.1 DNA gyrase/topoisomerase IV subunit A family protein [Babesia bovis T2Bo]|eukprot:XP_001609528.1 DNA gyrase A subunit [Babesia bovis T2Bo]